jgi:hypothetical protein
MFCVTLLLPGSLSYFLFLAFLLKNPYIISGTVQYSVHVGQKIIEAPDLATSKRRQSGIGHLRYGRTLKKVLMHYGSIFCFFCKSRLRVWRRRYYCKYVISAF